MYAAQGHQFKQFYMATNGYIQGVLGNCCLLILVIVYYLWSELVTVWKKILDCMIPSTVQKGSSSDVSISPDYQSERPKAFTSTFHAPQILCHSWTGRNNFPSAKVAKPPSSFLQWGRRIPEKKQKTDCLPSISPPQSSSPLIGSFYKLYMLLSYFFFRLPLLSLYLSMYLPRINHVNYVLVYKGGGEKKLKEISKKGAVLLAVAPGTLKA